MSIGLWSGCKRSTAPRVTLGLVGIEQSRFAQTVRWQGGFPALTINGPWRLVFRFADGDAHDVEIVDYH